MKICKILLIFILFSNCYTEDEIFESSIPFKTLNSTETGINFSNNLKYKTKLNIIEYLYYYNGGGVSVGDINNEIDMLLYHTQIYPKKNKTKYKNIE